jgi:DNA-binding transcriptional regulator YhcF (GntR family)
MKIWLSKNSEIPMREQIVTQITLGIMSGDLKTGERLPSTNEIARRFKVHANTVGSAYQKLTGQNLIEFKKGSGFFVSENKTLQNEGDFKLDRLIAEFFRDARARGFSAADIQKHLKKWFSVEPPERFLVVENDERLREIVTEEISQSIDFQIDSTSFDEFRRKHSKANAIFAAMIDEMPKIQAVLPPDKTCVYLKARSVPSSMIGETRPSADDLIAVVSGWEKFLLLAKTMLTAANVESDSIILRSTAGENWQKGLNSAAMIICDALAARKFPDDKRVRIFRIVADESLSELREIAGA